MTRITIAALLASTAAAHAGPVSYSSYAVLNAQTVTITDTAFGIANEQASAGRIDLATPGGILSTFCIDVAHALLPSGMFAPGASAGGAVGALIAHSAAAVASDPNGSAAMQVAVWRAEYGSALSVAAPAAVTQLADAYLADVTSGAWTPGSAATLVAAGNQSQAYAPVPTAVVAPQPVDEPASLALLGAGLVAAGLARRRTSAAQRGRNLDILA